MWWGSIMYHLRNSYRESVITSAVMNAITKLCGTLSLRKLMTVLGILKKLDQKFKISTDIDVRMWDLYNIRQHEWETTQAFASRVSDMVEVTNEFFPDQWLGDEVDTMCHDQFFHGLRDDH